MNYTRKYRRMFGVGTFKRAMAFNWWNNLPTFKQDCYAAVEQTDLAHIDLLQKVNLWEFYEDLNTAL